MRGKIDVPPKSVVPSDTLMAIYGAAVSPTDWPEVVDRCAFDASACSAAFLSFNVNNPSSYSNNAIGKLLRDRAASDSRFMPNYMNDMLHLK